MDIVSRFKEIKTSVPKNVEVVVVSKTQPVELIREIHNSTGHAVFGENKAQELIRKSEEFASEAIQWHFIGHLQTNKVKSVLTKVNMIQSVDSYRLLNEINKEARKQNLIIPCLLQFHIAREEAKFGFEIDEVKRMLDTHSYDDFSNIIFKGVMGMSTLTNDSALVRSEFKSLFTYYQEIKRSYFRDNQHFSEISMGMSDDYQIAIDEGSTMVRIGSLIFGSRK